MSNYTRTTLYTGVTSNLKQRVSRHKEGKASLFTTEYKCIYLVYYEQLPTIKDAIIRETRIKTWQREWKDRLIASINPELKDLFDEI